MNQILPHSIENSAARFPDREAFRHGERSISFSELTTSAIKLSRVLADCGIEKGDRVGVFVTAGVDCSVAIYGIMLAGAAFVPLDTAAPSPRIRFLIEDCGIDLLISKNQYADKLREVLSADVQLRAVVGVEFELPCPTVPWSDIENAPAQKRSLDAREHDLAYIMYTSGTTGLPKGIMHTHFSGLSYAKLSKSLYGINENDRLGSHSALHFDMSTLGFLTIPYAGGTTVVIPEAHKKFPASLSKLIEEERLTIWYSVPLALVQMINWGSLPDRNLETLRWVLFGGEPFHPKHLALLIKAWPNASFSNVYGPAEVNQCTYHNVESLPVPEDVIPLGGAWDDTELLVVDELDREVDRGERGELLVKSPTMMKGYWGQPDLTKQALFERKTVDAESDAFYRTGDIVRSDENGDLIFLGRKDRQFKTRGFRVEPDEIEAALVKHKNIKEAAVYSVKSDDDETLVGATVVFLDKNSASFEEVRKIAAGSLPHWALPSRLNELDSLPRKQSGKVDYSEVKRLAIGTKKFEARH